MMAFYSVFENGTKRFRPTPDLEALLKQDVIAHGELKQFRSSNKVDQLLRKVLESRGFKPEPASRGWVREKPKGPNQLLEWAKHQIKKGHTLADTAKMAGVSVKLLLQAKVHEGLHPVFSHHGEKVVKAQVAGGNIQIGDMLVMNSEKYVVKAVEGEQPIGIALENSKDGIVTVQLAEAGSAALASSIFQNASLGEPFAWPRKPGSENLEAELSEEMVKDILLAAKHGSMHS